MRKVALVGVICALGVGLGGCRTIPTTEGDANLGCKESFRQTASWKIKGFEIPFQSKLIGTVKIGEVEYSPEQAQKISDTIRMLDQARLGNCSLTTSNNFRLLSQETRDQIFLKASAGYGAIIDFAAGLEKAKTVDEGRSAQDKAAGEIPKVKPPIEPPKPVALVDSQAREAAAEVGASLVNLRSEVLKLSQAIDEVLGRGVQRIEVSGFAPDGSALLAEQRNFVAADFRKALSAVPASRTPNVLLIGYADGKGARAYNADLALRRAANVAEFLRRQDFGRRFHTEVTSGGVLTQEDGERARRVDIVVS